MKQSHFSLVPFSLDTTSKLNLTGTISRQDHQLRLTYLLAGDLSTIIIPQPIATPIRQYDLWEHTCCEFFLGLKNSTAYWEFNLSPTGNWNVFYLTDYRQDLTEEMAFKSLPFSWRHQTDLCQLNIQVDLNQIITPEQELEIGITTVIENHNQQLSYWALKHPGKEADFHRRDSFLIFL